MSKIFSTLRTHKWLIAGLVLGFGLILFAGESTIYKWLDRKFDRQISEQKKEIGESEREASAHRERVAQLESERPELVRKVAATDSQINASKRREEVTKNEIAEINRAEARALAMSADVDSILRRKRICTGFAEEGIPGGEYCARVK